MWATAQYSLLKMRESAFYMLMAIAIVLSIFANTADPLTEQVSKGSLFAYAIVPEEGGGMILSVGSCVALLISVLISSFYGSSEIPSDVDSGMIMIILSKPIGRFRYLAGKYLAIVIMAFSIYLLLQVSLFCSSRFLGLGSAAAYGNWQSVLSQLVPALFLFPLVAMNIFCSIIAGALGAMIFTGFYLIFSLAMSFIPVTMALFPQGMVPGLEQIMFLLHYLFINPLFYFREGAVNLVHFISLLLYSLSILVFFLVCSTCVLFSSDINAKTH